jgi:hypothetical protein
MQLLHRILVVCGANSVSKDAARLGGARGLGLIPAEVNDLVDHVFSPEGGVTSCDFRKERVLNFGGRFEFLKNKMAVLAGVFNIVWYDFICYGVYMNWEFNYFM